MPTGYTHLSGLMINGAVVDPVQRIPNTRQMMPGGKTLWVGSAGGPNTAGTGDGSSPDAPLATLALAMAQLSNRQNKGDVIYVLPGHTESVSSADYFSAVGTASYFSVIGLGAGATKPVFNWTTATSTWLFDTAGVEVSNLKLNLCGSAAAGALTVATPITVSAVDCRIVNCEINWGQDTDTGCGSTLGAIAVTAAGFEFINNRCYNLDTAGTLAVSFLSINGSDNCKIIGNQITGGTTSTTVGAIHFVTTASKNIFIMWNQVENLKASSTKAVTSAIASVTGAIAYNQLRVQLGIVGFTIAGTPFLCSFFQNFTNNTDTKNGALDVANGTSA